MNQALTENELKTETYSRQNLPEVEEMGARLYDQLKIVPSMGSTRVIKVNRCRVEIQIREKYLAEIDPQKIVLPSLGQGDQKFELTLLYPNKDQEDEAGRFLLSSIDNEPFRLNGRYSFRAFIERGDLIELGYNRLQFLQKFEEVDSKNQSNLLTHKKILRSQLPILIEGETGTGKSTLARELHEKSGRVGKFVQLNLASFSKGLIESELFGHVKGAFTGAIFEKSGAVLEANKGTLFLDEIDSLPLDIQTKLLLFLDSKEFRPVGGSFSKTASVRFIFASGRPLEGLVDSKEMRRDFYYRLSCGAKISLKSLRNSPDLISAFCRKYCHDNNINLSRELLEFYQNQQWSGNYRQLKGHLEKKALSSNGRNLVYDNVDEELLETPEIVRFDLDFLSLKDIKSNYAKRVYQSLNKNLSKTAEVLDVTKTTCRKLIKS